MEHNDKIRQEYRDKEDTLIMSTDFNGVPFSSEYVLWLEDELNELRIQRVSQQRELLIDFAETYQNCHLDDNAKNTVDWYLRTKDN